MQKVGQAVVIAYYLVLIAVILWSLSDEPASPRAWHASMRTCQSLARFFGHLGIASESAYYEAVERSR